MANGNPFFSKPTTPEPNVHSSLLAEMQGSSEDWVEQMAPDQLKNAIELHLSQARGSEKPVTWVQGKLRDSQGVLPPRRSSFQLGAHRSAPGPETTGGSGQGASPDLFGLRQPQTPWQSGQRSGGYSASPATLFGTNRPPRQNGQAADLFGIGSTQPSAPSPADIFGRAAPTTPEDLPRRDSGYLQASEEDEVPVYHTDEEDERPSPYLVTGQGEGQDPVVYHSTDNEEDADAGLYNSGGEPSSPSAPRFSQPMGSIKAYKYGQGVFSRVSSLENDARYGSSSVREVYQVAFQKATEPPQVTRVRYLDKPERPNYRVSVVEGKLSLGGKLMDTTDAQCLTRRKVVKTVGAVQGSLGLEQPVEEVSWEPEISNRYIWVMSRNGTIYAADWAAEYMKSGWEPHQKEVTGFHHSSFLGNKNVAAAGEIVVELGEVKWISNASGHYKPSAETLLMVLNELDELGADWGNARVQLAVGRFGVGHEYRASEFVAESANEKKLTRLD